MACQICKGQYSGTNDRKYVEDVTNFFSLSNRDEKNMGVLLKYLKYNPQDRWGRFKILSANSKYTAPLAVAFAQALKTRYSPMSSDEKSEIDKVEKIRTSDYAKLFTPPARLIAESLLSFLDGDLEAAEAHLRKIQIPDRVSTSSEGKFEYDFMSANLKDLEREIVLMISSQYEASGNIEAKGKLWENFSTRNKK
ncbi:MAG: hypothetical protein IPJ71_15130 [Bdellovibrionales bacterium]|nr:hypothetical protein [Bdellovibrionales bacterium]